MKPLPVNIGTFLFLGESLLKIMPIIIDLHDCLFLSSIVNTQPSLVVLSGAASAVSVSCSQRLSVWPVKCIIIWIECPAHSAASLSQLCLFSVMAVSVRQPGTVHFSLAHFHHGACEAARCRLTQSTRYAGGHDLLWNVALHKDKKKHSWQSLFGHCADLIPASL